MIPPSKAIEIGLNLFSTSPYHRPYTTPSILSYLIYPIKHNKIRFFFEGEKPVGLVTWCWLTSDKAQRFLDSSYMLGEEDYKAMGGEELWGIEFISTNQNSIGMMREMVRHHKEVYGTQTEVNWRRLASSKIRHKKVFK